MLWAMSILSPFLPFSCSIDSFYKTIFSLSAISRFLIICQLLTIHNFLFSPFQNCLISRIFQYPGYNRYHLRVRFIRVEIFYCRCRDNEISNRHYLPQYCPERKIYRTVFYSWFCGSPNVFILTRQQKYCFENIAAISFKSAMIENFVFANSTKFRQSYKLPSQ